VNWLPSEKTLKEVGVEDIIILHISESRFKDIQEVEKELKQKFDTSIISVVKTKNGYFCTVFKLEPEINEYIKKVLEPFINMYTLGLFAEVREDNDLKYLVDKTNFALTKLLNEIGNILENIEFKL